LSTSQKLHSRKIALLAGKAIGRYVFEIPKKQTISGV
jgi:hypothetical protein